MIVLETARLRLRRLGPHDSAFVLALLNQPSFIANIGDRHVRDEDAARRYIQDGPVACHEQFGYGLDLVEVKATGEAAGICGLVRRAYLDDPDIGYAFVPACWSRGYAVEAASAVLLDARERLGLARVLAIVSQRNERSIRVLERIGLRYERLITPPGESQPLLLFTTSGAA